MTLRRKTLLIALASAVALASEPATAEESGPSKPNASSGSATVDRAEPELAEENEIYSCQDQGGNLVLQTEPCPTVRKRRIAPHRPVAAGSGAEAAGRQVDPVVNRPAGAVAEPSSVPARRSPVARVPQRIETATKGPVETNGPAASRWVLVPRGKRTAPEPRRNFGKQNFPTRLGGDHQPSGASFSTPERTWRTFLAAVERGDRAVAVDCFTPSALEKYGPDTESFPLDDLKSMLDSLTRIENGGDLGPLWSIQGVRTSRQPKWIFFEETPAGEWKLTGL